MKDINYFDLVCILIFISFAFAVYKRGFIKEIFSRLSWIVAALMAFIFTSTLGLTITKKLTSIENEPLLYLISFLLIFVISYVIISLIGSSMDNLAQVFILNKLNKALGIILGLLEATIIIAIIVELLLLQNFLPQNTWMEGSKIAPFFVHYILQLDLKEILPSIEKTIPTIKV